MKSGRFGTTGRAVPGERDGKVYARNRCRKALIVDQFEPGGSGLDSGAYPGRAASARRRVGSGNCRNGLCVGSGRSW